MYGRRSIEKNLNLKFEQMQVAVAGEPQTCIYIWTGGRWNEFELEKARNNEINYLEMLATGLALKSLHIAIQGMHMFSLEQIIQQLCHK